MSYFVLSSLSFENTKANVAKKEKPFNWVNKSISLLLLGDSVSLSCSPGLKEFEISIF